MKYDICKLKFEILMNGRKISLCRGKKLKKSSIECRLWIGEWSI